MFGLPFIPEAGIQQDEAQFGAAIYDAGSPIFSFKLSGRQVPLMEMTYLGCLKAWIYTPIFRRWKPSPASIRFPVLVFGAVTIWLFWLLLLRIAGLRAAAIGGLLLAADTSFLITTCFDWGPVVLQHLLLVSGVFCLLRFHQDRNTVFLPLGFFFFGLGLWDKALFIWILSGMAIATLAVFPKELWRACTLWRLSIATVAFCLGAAPLIGYNIDSRLATFRSNTRFDASQLPGKVHQVVSTLSGQVLFGYIAREDPESGNPRAPQTAVERFSTRISQMTGGLQNGFLGYALLLAFLLLPWLWFTPARRPMVFALIAAVVAWLQMLFGKDTGGSPHHVILLWPFPALFIAVAFAESSRRLGRAGKPLLALVVLVVAGSGVLVSNEYLARLARNGPGVVWTDAIYPLSDHLRRVKPPIIYLDDWGMSDNLILLNRGGLPLSDETDPLTKSRLSEDDRRLALDRLSNPDAVHVARPNAIALLPGVNEKLLALATDSGYRRELLARISDRNGRPMFELFRFSK